MVEPTIGYQELVVPILGFFATFILFWDENKKIRIAIGSILVGIVLMLLMSSLNILYLAAQS